MFSQYYDMIFKRKSFHTLRSKDRLSGSEIDEIIRQIGELVPLDGSIKTEIRLVLKEQTTCRYGEYCVLLYSEEKPLSLQNAGYILEQLDLWLASRNIGACWYGLGKTDIKPKDGLSFVIMLTIGKVEPTQFRRDCSKAKRLPVEAIRSGDSFDRVINTARYAPSACNTQPWFVDCGEHSLSVSRVYRKRGIMPRDRVAFYNRIDLGIFMLFTELSLEHEGFAFSRKLFTDSGGNEKSLNAVYDVL